MSAIEQGNAPATPEARVICPYPKLIVSPAMLDVITSQLCPYRERCICRAAEACAPSPDAPATPDTDE